MAPNTARTIEDQQAAYEALMRFAARPESRETLDFGHEMFWDDLLDDAPPELVEFADSDALALASFLYAAVDLADDEHDPDAPTILDRFLATEKAAVTPAQRRFLSDLAGTWVGLYEVEQIRLHQGLSLRDLWTGELVEVRERLATEQLQQWDLLAARLIAHPDGHLELNGDSWPFPRRAKRLLLDELRDCAEQLEVAPGTEPRRVGREFLPYLHGLWWDLVVDPEPPVLTNSDGETLEFHRHAFTVHDPAATAAALDACRELSRAEGPEESSWSWFEDASDEYSPYLGSLELDGDVLTLETMSAARAARGQALIEAICAGLITAVAEEIESPADRFETAREQARRGEPTPEPDADLQNAPEARAILERYLDDHYRTWPDVPLPALGGHTPRDAAADPELADAVVDLLKDLENIAARDRRAGRVAYDCGWIWDELGLAHRRA